MRVHRACAGFGQKLYACAIFIIDGLGHATWSSKMPVSRSGTAPFWRNRHIIFRARVALESLLSLVSRFGACSARISGDRHTHTHTDTHTDTQNDYRNPRCACAPRVNNNENHCNVPVDEWVTIIVK